MPEGDTVFRTARALHQALTGQVLLRTDFRVPAYATVDLAGGTVAGTVSRGKHLLTRIVQGGPPGQLWTLHTHLKMEGAWRVYRPEDRWRRPSHQARVVLGTADAVAVGFSLGIVELLPTAEEPAVVGHLGPDLLGPDWDEAEAVRRLRLRPERTIRAALLDQTNLAGLGTLYAAELCFLSGVHPLLPVSRVPDLSRLVRRARQLLQQNSGRAVQSTTGSLREAERLWVFRRDRRPCRRCGTRIQVATFGEPGRERAGYWCPGCQPAPG